MQIKLKTFQCFPEHENVLEKLYVRSGCFQNPRSYLQFQQPLKLGVPRAWLRSSVLQGTKCVTATVLDPELQIKICHLLNGDSGAASLVCLLRGKGSIILWGPSKFWTDSLKLKDTAAECTAVHLLQRWPHSSWSPAVPDRPKRNQKFISLCLQVGGKSLKPSAPWWFPVQSVALWQPFLLLTWLATLLAVYSGRVDSSWKWAP